MTSVPGQPATARSRHWWSIQPARTGTTPISTRRAYAEVLAVFGAFFAAPIALAGFSVAGSNLSGGVAGWTDAVPGSIDQVAVTALAIGVPLLVAGRRGLTRRDLGLTVRGSVGLGAGIRMSAWAVLALIAGGVVTSQLMSGRLPLGHPSYPALTLDLFHAAQAGFLEEVVVLAFVVVTLQQARRPLPEIVVVAVVLRASYHIYYGPGVAGILVWATAFVWLYLRFRTIVPLIVVHSTWDLFVALAARWHLVASVEGLALLALFITAPITWLVARAESHRTRPPGLPAPGWYPDPGGAAQLRWWTGDQWWFPPPAPPAPPAPWASTAPAPPAPWASTGPAPPAPWAPTAPAPPAPWASTGPAPPAPWASTGPAPPAPPAPTAPASPPPGFDLVEGAPLLPHDPHRSDPR